MRFLGSGGLRVEAALRDLESDSTRARVIAAESLGAAHREAARVTPALRSALKDPSPDVRYAAALALGQLGDATSVEQLCGLLQDPEPMPQQAAAVALGEIGDPRAFGPLTAALEQGSPELRFQAVTALAQVDPGAAAEPLRGALDDADPEVRASAAAALGDIQHEPSRDLLARAVEDADPRVRGEAAMALARMGDCRGAPALIQMLEDGDYGLLAAEHLFRCPDPEAAPALERALDRWLTPPLLKVWAAGALARLGRQPARAELAQLLSSNKETVRGLTIQVLGEIDQPWSRKVLKDLLRGHVAREWEPWREEILEALGRPSEG